MDSNLVTGYNYGYMWAFYSFVCFGCNNFILGLLVPAKARRTQHHIWKWRNIANSFLHSLISGCWAMLCFWQSPEMREDLMNKYSVSAHAVTALSVGYFFYDLIDMGLYDAKRSRDLLFHHCLVILCLGLSLSTRFYVGYSLAALLVEVNSVFLHLRQLMLLQGIQKSSTIYRINGVLNIATFVVFRIINMAGMTQWLLVHRGELPSTAFGLGIFTMIIIMVMNLQLLMRVLRSDYFEPSTKPEEKSSELEEQRTMDQTPKSNGKMSEVKNGLCSNHVLGNGTASNGVTVNGKSTKME